MRKLVFYLLGFTCLISCEKSSTNDQDPMNYPDLIVKAVGIDTTRTSPFDTAYRANYQYDHLKRPIFASSIEFTQSGDTAYYQESKFHYNGSDSLASQCILKTYYRRIFSEPMTWDIDTTRYFFVNGRIARDSSFGITANGENRYSVGEYSYDGASIIHLTTREYHPLYGFNNSRTTFYQTFIANNIIHQIDTVIRGIGANTVYHRREQIATYLPNPNPLSKISDPIRRPYLNDDLGIGSRTAAPRNLYLQHRGIYNTWGQTTNNEDISISYNYEFRPDGYPIKVRESYSSGHEIMYLLFYE